MKQRKIPDGWVAEQAGVIRTQRRLFEGRVLVPESRLKSAIVSN